MNEIILPNGRSAAELARIQDGTEYRIFGREFLKSGKKDLTSLPIENLSLKRTLFIDDLITTPESQIKNLVLVRNPEKDTDSTIKDPFTRSWDLAHMKVFNEFSFDGSMKDFSESPWVSELPRVIGLIQSALNNVNHDPSKLVSELNRLQGTARAKKARKIPLNEEYYKLGTDIVESSACNLML